MKLKRIYIEITNVCDLSCSFCKKNQRSPEFMSLDFFEEVLKQAVSYTPYIYLHVQGEPLLHPEIHKILDYCLTYGAKVTLVTNGTFLAPQLITHPSLYKVSVSLQSMDSRSPDSIDSYLSRILETAETASRQSSPFIELRLWRNDLRNTSVGKKLMKELEQRYDIQETVRKGSIHLLPHVFMSFDNEFEWPALHEVRSTQGTCLGGRNQLAVLSNGMVVPCCLDADGLIPLGNLHESELSYILESDRYQKLIHGFQTNRIEEPLCQSCTYRYRFDSSDHHDTDPLP
ncbi:MAG: SPASM domain-containing protein [Solobacterium sp.]|nr:SPASM domain-containing protein [Solobacterium sp.]